MKGFLILVFVFLLGIAVVSGAASGNEFFISLEITIKGIVELFN